MGRKRFLVWFIGTALVVTLGFGCAPRVPASAQGAETPTPSPTATPISKTEAPASPATKPWLGVMVQDVTKEIAEGLGLKEEKGAVIAAIVPGSPAAEAGLKRGDVIRQVGDAEIANADEVAAQVQKAKASEQLTLKITRGGEEQLIEVTLGESPHPLFQGKEKLPPSLGWLEGLDPNQVFEHFLGGELRLKDLEGQLQSLRIIAGVVREVGEDSLSLIPNGETEAVTFAVSGETMVFSKQGVIPLSEVKAGGQALVVTLGKPDETKLVVLLPEELSQGRWHPFFERPLPQRRWDWRDLPRKLPAPFGHTS